MLMRNSSHSRAGSRISRLQRRARPVRLSEPEYPDSSGRDFFTLAPIVPRRTREPIQSELRDVPHDKRDSLVLRTCEMFRPREHSLFFGPSVVFSSEKTIG